MILRNVIIIMATFIFLSPIAPCQAKPAPIKRIKSWINAYNGSDYGMLDVANKTWYGNAGTGSFTVGS